MKKILRVMLTLVMILGITTVVKTSTINNFSYQSEEITLNRSNWVIEADSYHSNNVNGDGPASNLLDGNPSTHWHGAYDGNAVLKGDMVYPHNIIISFGEEEAFDKFSWLKRQNNDNGKIKRYSLYINNSSSVLNMDSVNNPEEAGWKKIKDGEFTYDDHLAMVDLEKTYYATQLLFVAEEPVNTEHVYATGAEFNLYRTINKRVAMDTTDMKVIASGVTEVGNGSADNLKGLLFDGQNTSYWQSKPKSVNGTDVNNYGTLNIDDSYVIIDLNKLTYVDRVDLFKRYVSGYPNNGFGDDSGNKAITGNMLNANIRVTSDSDCNTNNWTTVFDGAWPDSGSEQDGVAKISFSPTLARFIKISSTDTVHWSNNHLDKIMCLSDIKVYDRIVPERKAKNIALATNNPNMDNNGKGITVGKGKDAIGCKVSNDRPLKRLNDGYKNQYCDLHAINTAGASVKGSVYYQMDLGELALIEDVKFFRHPGNTYGPAVVMISSTEDFSTYEIVYNSDTDGSVHGFGNGTDTEVAITSEGTACAIDEPIAGRFVRLYGYGVPTENGSDDVHLYELEVYGYLAYDESTKANIVYSETEVSGDFVQESKYLYEDGVDVCLPNVPNSFIKYVDSSVLTIKAQSELVNNGENVNVRFISSVPSVNLEILRFKLEVLDGENPKEKFLYTSKVYNSIVADGLRISDAKDVFDNQVSEHFFLCKLNNIPTSDRSLQIKVTPYWVPYGYAESEYESNYIEGEYRIFDVGQFIDNAPNVISEGE